MAQDSGRRALSSSTRVDAAHDPHTKTESYPVPQGKVDIILPPSEDRGHRYFRLANGVECVVVSDGACDKAAGAVDVGVGSLEDREGLDGCAHFW
jgi:insulysin